MKAAICIALLLGVATLAGCATKPVNVGEAKPAPESRVYGYQAASGSAGAVTFVRDKGMMGAGCYLAVLVNGTPAAMLDTGEKVTLVFTPGRWNVGASPSGAGLCGSGLATRNKREVQVTVDAGDQLTYRIAIGQGGELNIGPVSY